MFNKKFFILFFFSGFIFLISAFFPVSETQAAISLNWTQSSTGATWSGRYTTALVFNNQLWVLGGLSYNFVTGSDVWRSSDGANWTQVTANVGWGGKNNHAAIVWNNKIGVMGGQNSGGAVQNDVWYSSDGVNWTQATAHAAWSARHHFGAVVYNNKMWIFGGSDGSALKNDVWYSTDGINWTQATASAAWEARSGLATTVYNNKIWLAGGHGSGGGPYGTYYDDIWYSTDGINWTRATASATGSPRDMQAVVVYSDKMWMMGGYNNSEYYKNDIWYSSDGANWTQSTANAAWSKRMGFAGLVLNNKIWVMGGYSLSTCTNNFCNDVWSSSFSAPTVSLKVNNSDGPVTVTYNTSVTISWTSANADSCTASATYAGAHNWSGTKAVSGSESTGNILSTNSFSISCTGSGGTISDLVIVYVTGSPPPATVTCDYTWPQQVIINGTAYYCDSAAHRGFCNNIQAQQGIAECCDWHEGAGYSNCALFTPPACTEDWYCSGWSQCINGQQTRVCADSNNCGTFVDKPIITQSCTCQENWSCGGWSACANSQQTRSCTDSSSCGTIVSRPLITQSCCSENWTCGDWSACANGNQTRTCTDSNSCGTTASKPSATQSCTCQENWSCSDWSSCVNGQQTKICTDLNNCGTSSSKPITQQICQVQCQESWSCANWSVCQNNQQTRTCTDSNNCGITNLKPMTAQSCGNICTENWSCGEWSGCLNSKQIKTCVDSNKCGTSKNKPTTEQNCVCVEKWTCGNWLSCINGQQTKICADSNNCGTTANRPPVKQSCLVKPEPKPQAPPTQPTVSASPSEQPTTLINVVKPAEGEKTETYIKDTKITIEKKDEGVFTIVSGDTVITTSLEIVSTSSKPYLKTSQGLKEIKNSPEEIKAKIADKISVVNKIEIKEQNEKTLFYVSGIRKAKLLFVFPVSVKMEFQIDMENGEINFIKKPWWSFLVKF